MGGEGVPSVNSYKVLLPKWVLTKKNELNEHQFLKEVQGYMKRYPHYIVDDVDGSFAICARLASKNQKEGSQGML